HPRAVGRVALHVGSVHTCVHALPSHCHMSLSSESPAMPPPNKIVALDGGKKPITASRRGCGPVVDFWVQVVPSHSQVSPRRGSPLVPYAWLPKRPVTFRVVSNVIDAWYRTVGVPPAEVRSVQIFPSHSHVSSVEIWLALGYGYPYPPNTTTT